VFAAVSGQWRHANQRGNLPPIGSLPLNNVTLGALPTGSSLRFNITVDTANSIPSPVITNTATLTPPQGVDPAVCRNAAGKSSCTTSSSVSTSGQMSITKTVIGPPGPFVPGDTVTYALTLTNEGSVDIPNVSVTDTLPAGLINGKWTCAVGSAAICQANGTIPPTLLQTVNLPAHARLVYIVTATVDKAALGKLVNTATADAGTGACWNGSASTPLPCTSSTDIWVISPVPLFENWGYWLTGLGILALAAAATARRRRAAAN
jgi:uncharacterized repeat protein (TIGR01451 family)